MRLTTRLRLAIVRKTAKWLGIPITVHEDALREVIYEKIDRYVVEAAVLLTAVWGAAEPTREKFVYWATKELSANTGNPFLLHEHPLYFGAAYLGIFDPESLRDGEHIFAVFAQNPVYANKFKDGWRVNFGLKSV